MPLNWGYIGQTYGVTDVAGLFFTIPPKNQEIKKKWTKSKTRLCLTYGVDFHNSAVGLILNFTEVTLTHITSCLSNGFKIRHNNS